METTSVIDPSPPLGEPVKSNGNGNKYLLCIVAVLLVLFLIYFLMNNSQSSEDCTGLFTDDVMFYYTPNCPYCVKQLEIFNENGIINNISTCDLTDEDCQKSFNDLGGKGVPYFVLKSDNSVTVSGLNSDMCNLATKLNLRN